MTPATTYRTALLSPSKHVQDQETFMCCSTVALINQPTDHTTQEREKTSESFSSRVNAILETWIEKSGQTFDGRLCKRRLVTEDIHELMRAARTPIWRARASTAFSNLRTLDLSRNQLTSLPDAFCRALPLLQKLNLSWNQLTSCPTALAHLTSLKELNLTNNQLSGPNALPGWLFRRWPDLRVLRLSANQITALPAELGELSTLEVLELGSIYGGNLLTEFPPGTLARLKSLVELNLTDNRLVELDLTTNDNDKVDRILPALMHLTLTNNRLAKLPEELAACRSLRTLCLGNNQLTNLPVELADLYDLEFLDITYNQLTFWPAELDVLAKRGCTIILAGNPLDMNVHKPENCQESIAESACQQDNTSINQTDNINHQDTISSAFETVHTHHINYGQKTPNCDVNQYHSPDISSPSHTDEALVSALQSLSLPAHLAAAVTHGYSMPLCRTLSQPPSAPSTPDTPSAWVTSTPTMTSTIHSGSIPTTPKVKSSGPPSLLELAARALLRHGQPVPYYSLPDHLTQYLAGGAHACAYCGGPFVGEWVGTLRRGRFGGHGVHRWLRYCSEQCQMNSDLDAATRTLASFQDCRVNFRSGHPCQNQRGRCTYRRRQCMNSALSNHDLQRKHTSGKKTTREANGMLCARWPCQFSFDDISAEEEVTLYDNTTNSCMLYGERDVLFGKQQQETAASEKEFKLDGTNEFLSSGGWCDPDACAPRGRRLPELAVTIDHSEEPLSENIPPIYRLSAISPNASTSNSPRRERSRVSVKNQRGQSRRNVSLFDW